MFDIAHQCVIKRLNSHRASGLNLFDLSPEWITWHNGHRVPRLSSFDLFDFRPQWVSWLNGPQNPPLDLLPVTSLRHGHQGKDSVKCFIVPGRTPLVRNNLAVPEVT